MNYQILDRQALKLPAKLAPLIASIEKAFGRPVVFAIVDDLTFAEAFGGLEDDGTLLVGMRPDGCREITIAHELLHLECEAAGFPRTRTLRGTPELPAEHVSRAVSEWFCIVEHQVIYSPWSKFNAHSWSVLNARRHSPFHMAKRSVIPIPIQSRK